MGTPIIQSRELLKSQCAPLLCALLSSFLFSCVTATSPDGPAARQMTTRRYAQLDPPVRGQRVLVIAPHIDDEVLGAGGYVADAVDAGAEVFIVYLTGGDYSRVALLANRLTILSTADLNRKAMAKAMTRMAEARRSAARLGVDPSHILLLGYPDRGLATMLEEPQRTIRSTSTGRNSVPYPQAISPGALYRLESLYADLESIMLRLQPTVVIGPIEQDHHPDHRAAAKMLSQLLDGKSEDTVRIGYLIHAWRSPMHRRSQALEPPSRLRDADWVVYPLSGSARHTKRQALSEFKTQRRSPYLRAVFRSLDKNNELFLRVQ